VRWLIAVGLVAGCYSPGADPACLTRCDPVNAGQPAACPDGLVCAADGMCRLRDGSCTDQPVDDAALADMRPDDRTNFCYGNGLLRICLDDAPMVDRTYNATNIDTATAAACVVVAQSGGPDLCVIAGVTLQLTNVRAFGPRPLVLIGTSRIELAGSIDVASRRIEGASVPAAGSNDTSCSTTNNPVANAGGNGGSFGGRGGNGGRSGTPLPMPVDPLVLRGGCPGQNGNENPSALGGRGGGAIYFISEGTIAVGAATINASGAGGRTAMPSGGGGGGSGGMIGFDAPNIVVSSGGQAFANGGGGGGGANTAPGGDGGESTAYQVAGPGGPGIGAYGGEGSLVSVDGEPGEGVETYGGGGGGGAGVIVIHPSTQSGAFGVAVSPPVRL
jgi:hypothetical protein